MELGTHYYYEKIIRQRHSELLHESESARLLEAAFRAGAPGTRRLQLSAGITIPEFFIPALCWRKGSTMSKDNFPL
jgi:hypothetical protein